MITPATFEENRKLRERLTIIDSDGEEVKKFINSSLLGSNVYETDTSFKWVEYKWLIAGCIGALAAVTAYSLIKKSK